MVLQPGLIIGSSSRFHPWVLCCASAQNLEIFLEKFESAGALSALAAISPVRACALDLRKERGSSSGNDRFQTLGEPGVENSHPVSFSLE